MTHLTAMDVRQLTQEPSAKVRGVLAAKIAIDYRDGNFTASEAEIATDIFRILLKDTETIIRRSLAEQLAHCPQAPHDIILTLARDETEVAVHVLEHSNVLTEQDLVQIVRSTGEIAKLCAIARRKDISKALSSELMDKEYTAVLQSLFVNRSASLTQDDMEKHWDSIAASPTLLEALVHRGGLPLTIVEKLFHAVSDELKRHLAARYKLNKPFMHKAVADVKEWEMLGLVPADTGASPYDDELVEDLVEDLFLKGRLTHSLLIRALCVGNLNIFEAGIAKLANVPRVNARILMMDGGGLGLKAIYRAATMPDGFFDAISVLLRISLEETEYGRQKPGDFRKRVIDRITVGKYNRTVENMEYLFSIIGGKILVPAAVH